MKLKHSAFNIAAILLACSLTFMGVMVFFLMEPSILHLAISSIIAVSVTYYVFEIRKVRIKS